MTFKLTYTSNTYITSYIKINSCTSQCRYSNDIYLLKFLIKLFHKNQPDTLYIFISKEYFYHLSSLITDYNVYLIPFTKEWLSKNSYFWKYFSREKDIINSNRFKNIISNGKINNYYHCINPKEAIFQHLKIDFIEYVINNFKNTKVYTWIDFNYFYKLDIIPEKLLDITKFNLNTVTFQLTSNLENIRANPFYYFIDDGKSSTSILSSCIIGSRISLFQLINYYKKIFRYNQKVLKISSTVTMILIQLFFKNNNLFSFYRSTSNNTLMFYYQMKLKNYKRQPIIEIFNSL